ncbi:hypothetical protein [Nonomuraea longicatena]|uniref:Uncharacterized protein n=1 Tax=Nonomuraea longicatena TaxID=83682 RepID=A0ABP4A5E2_9ACTN
MVPWAKAGLLVRQSLEQGTPYAAVMLTGAHGVRMQHNYIHDVPGGPHNGPQWLRLTRSGDIITGYESDDGKTWTEVGTVALTGLPETVEIGVFATSPGALWDMAQAFAQATATFVQITLRGRERFVAPRRRRRRHGVRRQDPASPGRVVESGDKLIVIGVGDIGPATVEGGVRADLMLIGGALGMIRVLVVAVTFFTAEHRRGLIGTGLPAEPHPARLPAAKAVVVGAVAFVAGLVTSGVVVPVGLAMSRANQNPIQPITLATELRIPVHRAACRAAADTRAAPKVAALRGGRANCPASGTAWRSAARRASPPL